MRISYDAYDLPVEVTSGNEVWTMEYTPMGNLRRQTRRTSSMRMVSALNYEYDSYDRLKFVENEHGERYFFERDLNGEVICERGFDGAERHYIRDLDGTVITTQLPDGTTVNHQHDQAGRLTYNKYTDGSWEAWEYDKAGRLTKAYNRDSVTEFVRNALGQVIKETQDGRTVEHKYDERSRLSNIVSALGGSITYGYDIKGTVNVSILNSPLLPVILALLPLCKKLMFVLNETNIYRVCCTPVDMRQGILRLSQLVRSYNFTPSDGAVYIFYNRSRNCIKLLKFPTP